MDLTNIKLRSGKEFRSLVIEKSLSGKEISIRGEVNVEDEKGTLVWRDCVWDMEGQIVYPVKNLMLDLIQAVQGS